MGEWKCCYILGIYIANLNFDWAGNREIAFKHKIKVHMFRHLQLENIKLNNYCVQIQIKIQNSCLVITHAEQCKLNKCFCVELKSSNGNKLKINQSFFLSHPCH